MKEEAHEICSTLVVVEEDFQDIELDDVVKCEVYV